jgi:hypothetical protein
LPPSVLVLHPAPPPHPMPLPGSGSAWERRREVNRWGRGRREGDRCCSAQGWDGGWGCPRFLEATFLFQASVNLGRSCYNLTNNNEAEYHLGWGGLHLWYGLHFWAE